MTAEELVARLERVRRTGSGWEALCPAHEDRKPSLTVSDGDKGVVVHCHAGCKVEQIVAALDLQVTDLFCDPPAANGNRRIVGTYDYVDELGKLRFQVVRYEPKDFRQRRPDGNGGWIWNLRGVDRVLYRLPLVLAAHDRPVWIVEGEKDADALEDVGIVATTCPMGAGKWHDRYADSLRGASEIVIVADKDEQGVQHARAVAASVLRVVDRVRIVQARLGKDAFDHLAAGLSRDDFEPLPDQTESPGADTGTSEAAFEITIRTTRELCALPDSDHGDELLGPLVRRGARTIIGGHTGEGKTTIVGWMIAAIVKLLVFLDWAGAGGKVLVLDLEQGLRSVKRLLREVGLDDSDHVDYALIPEGLALDKDTNQADAIEQLLRTNRYDVVVLDPHYKAHTGDSNDERQVDDLMRLFDRWRSTYGFALILPAHCRKPQAGAPGAFTIHDIFGSSAFLRGAEIVLGLRRVSDGYSKLHFFKDRDGDLPVPDSWGLIFDRETGYHRDPNDGKTRDLRTEILEHKALNEWRTLAEIRAKKDNGGIGADKNTIKPALDQLVSEGLLDYQEGPPGRSAKAKCWRLASGPKASDASGQESTPPGDPDAATGVLASPYRDDSKTPVTRDPRATDTGLA